MGAIHLIEWLMGRSRLRALKGPLSSETPEVTDFYFRKFIQAVHPKKEVCSRIYT